MNNDFVCDTIKLSEDSKKIYDLTVKYMNDIHDFFKLFEFLSQNSKTWSGEGAKAFYQKTMNEKKQYDEFGNGLKNLANEIDNFANKLDNMVLKNESLYDDPITSSDMVNGG